MKLYGGSGHRISKPGKGGQVEPQDEYYYDYYSDPRGDARANRADYDRRAGRDNDAYDRRYEQSRAAYSPPQPRRAAPPPQPPKKKRSGWRAFGTVMLVLAILVGCGYAYWMLSTKAPTKANQALPSASAKADDLNEDESEKVSGSSDRYYTVLIVGKDVAGLNTDTMMLCRYDSVDHKLNVCSLPRDTLVNISASVKKLNNVYASQNADVGALLDEVKDLAGFRPDSYVMIDTQAFVKMIDAMGGVDFDVPVT